LERINIYVYICRVIQNNNNKQKFSKMTNDKLKEATELGKQITDLEKIIESGKTQKCEWVEFTFGNGSNRANVCNDENIIQSIRELIVTQNEQKLAALKEYFSKL